MVDENRANETKGFHYKSNAYMYTSRPQLFFSLGCCKCTYKYIYYIERLFSLLNVIQPDEYLNLLLNPIAIHIYLHGYIQTYEFHLILIMFIDWNLIKIQSLSYASLVQFKARTNIIFIVFIMQFSYYFNIILQLNCWYIIVHDFIWYDAECVQLQDYNLQFKKTKRNICDKV